jgi:Holliday junction resolvase
MSQDKGRAQETQLCKKIYERTDGDLLPMPAGYSGNHGIPSADILIDDGTKIHAFELKRTGRERLSVRHDPDNTKRDDVHQLIQFSKEYPRTVAPYLGIRFDRRQIICSKLWTEGPNDMIALTSAVNTTPTDDRLTDAGNLSYHKPKADEWPSASSGDDVSHILNTINYN